MKKQLADKIRSIRAGKGLKQEDIADQLGIVIGTYSNIERGITDVTVVRLYQIAKVLKVSIYDLLPEETLPLVEEPTPQFDYAQLKQEIVAEVLKAIKPQLDTQTKKDTYTAPKKRK